MTDPRCTEGDTCSVKGSTELAHVGDAVPVPNTAASQDVRQ